ncbi:hypothetical protein [Chitinimonas sp. BJB300]|uniref:hypothetical protein n=1 Tax=Chitinimonas sp. BJB300 TaxID=1559339 RepID=UPI000C0D7702|nr:hypothetical protein [Chitinimonas sp. BJB300]PHV09634.1 hypothetical protein CSQ89_20630 [Chitinimonas sp. BJB300]
MQFPFQQDCAPASETSRQDISDGCGLTGQCSLPGQALRLGDCMGRQPTQILVGHPTLNKT